MQFTLTIDIPPLPHPVAYTDHILLTGSCFTEHIADRLQQHKFRILSNPHGILFNPLSVSDSLDSYIEGRQYAATDLFYLNELWNSWHHHTRFSHTDPVAALNAINESQAQAKEMIEKADWVIITLGSAFQYYLKDTGLPVANNHRAPAQWFEKRLLAIDAIVTALDGTLKKLFAINSNARVLFTISPVRHIRDGVTENNRSKARLIEVVHALCEQHEKAHYFPAYELVMDILRDYRFYDVDMVHPNYLGTSYVWEQFVKSCMAPSTSGIMQKVHDIVIARSHRSRFPATGAHKRFKESYAAKAMMLMAKYPYLDLNDEVKYFEAQD